MRQTRLTRSTKWLRFARSLRATSPASERGSIRGGPSRAPTRWEASPAPSSRRRSRPVSVLSSYAEATKPGICVQPKPRGVVGPPHGACLGVPGDRAMVNQLDQVPVGIVNVSVVLAGVLAASLLRVVPRCSAWCWRRRPTLDAELAEAGASMPFQSSPQERSGWTEWWSAAANGEVDFARAEAQLELPSVERRPRSRNSAPRTFVYQSWVRSRLLSGRWTWWISFA